MWAFPVRVIHGGIGLRRVEWLMRIELIHEQHEAFVMARILRQPARCRTHGAGAGEIFLAPEIAARVIIGHVLAHEVRRACPARIGPRVTCISLMAALVISGSEIKVVILVVHLEVMWMIGNQLRHHTRLEQLLGNGIYPKLARAPVTPEKFERTEKNVVTGGYARK